MKSMVAVLALVLLLVTPAFAISPIGNPAIMPLWAETPDGDRFMCTSALIFPRIGETRSLILTAGHCIQAQYAKYRETQLFGGTSSLVNWLAAFKGRVIGKSGTSSDVAIGVISTFEPLTRHFFLAENSPKLGQRVYIHGFPQGIETVVVGKVVDRSVLTSIYKLPAEEILPGSYVIKVNKAGDVLPGSSGSPVLNESGNIAGVLWGLVVNAGEPTEYAIVTPIERVHEMIKLLGLDKVE